MFKQFSTKEKKAFALGCKAGTRKTSSRKYSTRGSYGSAKRTTKRYSR